MASNNGLSGKHMGSTPANDPITDARWKGFEDARQGLGFRAEYDTLKAHQQRNYERGRQQAILIAQQTGAVAPNWKRSERFSSYLRRLPSANARFAVRQETDMVTPFWSGAISAHIRAE